MYAYLEAAEVKRNRAGGEDEREGGLTDVVKKFQHSRLHVGPGRVMDIHPSSEHETRRNMELNFLYQNCGSQRSMVVWI